MGLKTKPKTWRWHWWNNFGNRLKPVFRVSNERHVCPQAISYISITVTANKLALRCPPLQFIFPGIGTICIIELNHLFILCNVNLLAELAGWWHNFPNLVMTRCCKAVLQIFLFFTMCFLSLVCYLTNSPRELQRSSHITHTYAGMYGCNNLHDK